MARPIALLLVLVLAALAAAQPAGQAPAASIRAACLDVLPALADALLRTRVTDPGDPNAGALRCPESGDFHTRAAEAVYPFAVMYSRTGDRRYLTAAVALGNWLIRQQGRDGEWAETPWTWTGTTTDQLLMMALAYPVLEPHLTPAERAGWRRSMERAGAYLVARMNPDFATINYCATTPATLAVLNRVVPHPAYLPKARELARQVLARMNADGFIEGEAARVGAVKYGVDPAYEMDMSFWGLALYARLADDALVAARVRQAVATHLSLVYPNGLIDGSWGTRCYKWTTYGSKTADGSQILFSLLAGEDPRYRTAALRNLAYLRTMIRDGLVGSGPHFFDHAPGPPCLYPTFARAKNLAMAIELGDQGSGPTPPLPADEAGLLTVYPSVNVAVARSERFMLTVSAYHYVDQQNWGEGRYSQFPAGGSAANVWLDGVGLLQTSSPTRYVRGEVIHMPEIREPIRPLTPRIEFRDGSGSFTNLYERTGQLTTARRGDGRIDLVMNGELRNEQQVPGGVAYTLAHELADQALTKRVTIRYHNRAPVIDIQEPIVAGPGTSATLDGPRAVRIRINGRTVRLELIEGPATIVLGEDASLYRHPFPAVQAFPITLRLDPPARPFEDDRYSATVAYRFVPVDER